VLFEAKFLFMHTKTGYLRYKLNQHLANILLKLFCWFCLQSLSFRFLLI